MGPNTVAISQAAFRSIKKDMKKAPTPLRDGRLREVIRSIFGRLFKSNG
jgi:hypothetical protein